MNLPGFSKKWMPATSLGATYLGLLTLLAVAVFLALTIGPVRIGFAQLWESIIGRGTAISDTILFDVRAPRMVLGVIAGGSLAMARASLQGLLRNPLADPGLIGITAGVSLAVVFVIVLGETLLDNLPPLIVSTIIPIAAFLGALGVTAMVLATSSIGGRFSSGRLILIGVAITAIASALIGVMIFMSTQQFPLEILFVVLQWFNWIAENIFSWTFAAGIGHYAKKNVRQEKKP